MKRLKLDNNDLLIHKELQKERHVTLKRRGADISTKKKKRRTEYIMRHLNVTLESYMKYRLISIILLTVPLSM